MEGRRERQVKVWVDMACDWKTRFHEALTKESRDPVGEMWEDMTQSNRFQRSWGLSVHRASGS